MPIAQPAPGRTLLSPGDHTLILIDFQSQMASATKSIDPVVLRNNAALVANAAGIFGVSTIPTTVAEKTFSGPMFDEIKDAFPKAKFFDRTSMNTWEDKAVIAEINRIDKERVVLAGLWTSVCIVGPALSALDQGFEVHVIADACGDVSVEAHERAMDRMVQAGARPMTSLQYLLELQRDWARTETYDATTGLARTFGGAYGLGLIYAKSSRCLGRLSVWDVAYGLALALRRSWPMKRRWGSADLRYGASTITAPRGPYPESTALAPCELGCRWW